MKDKAILEFNAPSCCMGCILAIQDRITRDYFCRAVNEQINTEGEAINDFISKRASFCPLKIIKKIKIGDIVRYIPLNEKWVVCGINYERGELIPCGYPFPSIGKISDCELFESVELTEERYIGYINALKKVGCESFIND